MTRARRRYIANLLIYQAGVAAGAGAVGVLLLLFFGTQILDWQWPVAVFAAVLALGVYRVRRSLLPPYRTAQMLDRLLGLEDRLSTSFYFRRIASHAPESVDIVERQASGRVHPGDVDRVMPFQFPRSGWIACALLLCALGLVGLRYGLMRSLDLSQPIARIRFDTFTAPPLVEAASARKSVIQEHLEKQLEQLGMSLDEPGQTEKPGEKGTPLNVEAVAEEPGGSQKSGSEKGPDSASQGSEESEGAEKSPGEQTGESKEEGSGEPAASQKAQNAGAKNPKAAPKNAGTNPGVMDKMKDALANLMNKLGAKPQEQGQEKAFNENQAGNKQQMSQRGSQGQGRAQGDSEQTPDPQGGSDNEGGEKTPGQQQNAAQQDMNKPGDKSAKSGQGQSEGDKSIQDAEQLAAMGKISEIFGKRAAEIQGEMSVEVPSGKQQLKTAYSRNSATHSGAIVESDRNEIPLVYQNYVQRYFEEVRKTVPAKSKTAEP